MGIRTTAEYVENDQILEKLRELGVDYAQGYGLHVPQPLEVITELPAGKTANSKEKPFDLDFPVIGRRPAV
jgi:EAL domain-containing protein (putative c-di-GMP-specific phosphodiesterase class I)